MSILSQLVVRITGDTQQLIGSLQDADTKTQKFASNATSHVKGFSSALGGVGKIAAGVLGANVIAGGFREITGQLGSFITQAMESQQVQAQTNAVLASTKGVAGQTAASIGDLATKLSLIAPVDDEVIQSAENMLLTFTGIGKDVFPGATQAALDMATALKQDPVDAAKTLGMALNDPAQGITRLTRAGVVFTEEQKKQIKAMEAAGDTAGAQKLILAELTKEFGGSAKAAGQTAAGQFKIFQTQLGNVKETIGTALLPLLTQLATKLATFLADHQQDIQDFADLLATKLPKAIAAVESAIDAVRPALDSMAGTIRDGFVTIQPLLQWLIEHKPVLIAAFIAIGAAVLLAFTPVTLPIIAVAAAVLGLLYVIGLVRDHWDAIKAKTLEVWGAISDFMTSKLAFLTDLIKFAFAFYAAIIGAAFDTVKNIVITAFAVVRDIFVIALAVLRGDWGGAWDGIKQLVADVWEGIKTQIGTDLTLLRNIALLAWALVKNEAADGWAAVKGVILGVWDDIKSGIESAINWIKRHVNGLLGWISNIPGAGKVLDLLGHVPGFAGGGIVSGGLTLVGERGPELVNLPGGSRVYSNADSRNMVGASVRNFINQLIVTGDTDTGLTALGLSGVIQ